MSPQKDQEFLSDGICRGYPERFLTRLQGLKVIGRTSSFYFKGRNVEPPEIGPVAWP